MYDRRFYSNFSGKPELLLLMMERFAKATEEVVPREARGDDALYWVALWRIYMKSAGEHAGLCGIYEQAWLDGTVVDMLLMRYEPHLQAILQRGGYLPEEGTKRGVASVGMLHGWLTKDIFTEKEADEPDCKLFADLLLGVLGVCGEDRARYAERLAAMDDVLRDAAYKALIGILQEG